MLRRLLPFQNVVSNNTATLNMSNLLGLTIDRMILQLGGTFTKAQITGLRIKANSKTIFDDSGSRIDLRMQYRGITANASFLSIDFSEIRAKTIVGQKLGSFDTVASAVRQLTMEVDIGAATSPTLSGFADLSEPQGMADSAPLIGKVLNLSQSFAAAGTFPLEFGYGRKTPTLIKRLHLFGSTVLSAEVRRNGIPIFENLPDAINDFQQTEFQRTPQANVYTVDFIPAGNLSDALPLNPDVPMEYYVTVSGSGAVTVVAELLDPLDNN
jgi:hypothetical protein